MPALTPRAARSSFTRLLIVGLASVLLSSFVLIDDSDAHRKRQRAPVEPPLKITAIELSPEGYVAGEGSLNFDVDVELPPGTDGEHVLEVSTLITSPSSRQMRFLAIRQPVESKPEKETGADAEKDGGDAAEAEPERNQVPKQIKVRLTWDGTDQYSEVVTGGRYRYVLRAKLFAPEGNSLRTFMVSWKKSGTLQVKEAEVKPSHGEKAEDQKNDESTPQ